MGWGRAGGIELALQGWLLLCGDGTHGILGTEATVAKRPHGRVQEGRYGKPSHVDLSETEFSQQLSDIYNTYLTRLWKGLNERSHMKHLPSLAQITSTYVINNLSCVLEDQGQIDQQSCAWDLNSIRP